MQLQTSQSAPADPCPPPTSTFNVHMSIRTGSWSNGRGWPGLTNPVFFYITSKPGMCVSLTWERGGTRMH